MPTNPFPEIVHDTNFCIVGGGMPGLTAALAAARHGALVVLMQDRPVLGGNASSECRIHICGADVHHHHPGLRETGILEEFRLENCRRNPNRNYSVWDLVVYDKAMTQPNLTVLLNCSCLDAAMDGPRIASVRGWQTTTQTFHSVRAKFFADCSGDAVLAPLTGAQFRMGREARGEFGESIAPVEADARTMGMTCLFGARKHDTPQEFVPPAWARRFDSHDDMPYGAEGHVHNGWWGLGYWWIELGGMYDSIHDTEMLRHEVLKITLGVWDHIKNRGDHGAENWALDWLQFLPGKRESRRYVGDHVVSQGDIESEGRFSDLVAYGGWSMDDHHPAGFESARLHAPATIFHHAPSPYGIPYRALYSRNIENLFFAGRCASFTHAGMSELARVIGTGMVMGQAVGTAVGIALRRSLDTPRAVGAHVGELQQLLLLDDCYLPWHAQEMPALTREARLEASQGDPEPVRDGTNRPVGDDIHAWAARAGAGDWIAYRFDGPRRVADVTLLLDTDFTQDLYMTQHYQDRGLTHTPDTTPRRLLVETLERGEWRPLHAVEENYQRLVRIPVGREIEGVRYTLRETWGPATESRVYGFYVR